MRKHVDAEEPLRSQRFGCFESKTAYIVRPEPGPYGVRRYDAPAEEFDLSVLDSGPERELGSGTRRSVESVLGTRGTPRVLAEGDGVDLRAGQSALVPHAAAEYAVTWQGTLRRVPAPVGR